MAYDEALVRRIRQVLKEASGVAEKRMFGGVAFLRNGHMFVGVLDHDLMARIGPDGYDRALTLKHVREMDFTGKPLRGYVFVGPAAVKTAASLRAWVAKCVTFADSLPPKSSH